MGTSGNSPWHGCWDARQAWARDIALSAQGVCVSYLSGLMQGFMSCAHVSRRVESVTTLSSPFGHAGRPRTLHMATPACFAASPVSCVGTSVAQRSTLRMVVAWVLNACVPMLPRPVGVPSTSSRHIGGRRTSPPCAPQCRAWRWTRKVAREAAARAEAEVVAAAEAAKARGTGFQPGRSCLLGHHG